MRERGGLSSSLANGRAVSKGPTTSNPSGWTGPIAVATLPTATSPALLPRTSHHLLPRLERDTVQAMCARALRSLGFS